MQGARMALPLRHLKFKAVLKMVRGAGGCDQAKNVCPSNPSRYLELTDIKNNSTQNMHSDVDELVH